MTNIEEKAIDLVKKLVPQGDKFDFNASISDTSRSIEFFVWIDNVRKQCYDLADEGILDEIEMEESFDLFADSFRKSDVFESGKVNKIQFSFNIIA